MSTHRDVALGIMSAIVEARLDEYRRQLARTDRARTEADAQREADLRAVGERHQHSDSHIHREGE